MSTPVITGETTIAELERVLREHDLLVEVGQSGFRSHLWIAQAIRLRGAYLYDDAAAADATRASGATMAEALASLIAMVSR